MKYAQACPANVRLSVRPASGGWRVNAVDCFESMLFRSGRQAELQARRLGRRLASTGRRVVVEIYDRESKFIGAWRC